jgi:hypothetical protein
MHATPGPEEIHKLPLSLPVNGSVLSEPTASIVFKPGLLVFELSLYTGYCWNRLSRDLLENGYDQVEMLHLRLDLRSCPEQSGKRNQSRIGLRGTAGFLGLPHLRVWQGSL